MTGDSVRATVRIECQMKNGTTSVREIVIPKAGLGERPSKLAYGKSILISVISSLASIERELLELNDEDVVEFADKSERDVVTSTPPADYVTSTPPADYGTAGGES